MTAVFQPLENPGAATSNHWKNECRQLPIIGIVAARLRFAHRRSRMIRAGILCLLATFTAEAQTPRRGVVSLAPNLTELMCSIGVESQLVARSSACDFPESVKSLPVAGDFGRPNIEAIARLRPATLIFTDVENPAAIASLRQTGVECLKLSCEGWTNLIAAAETLGRALGEIIRVSNWIARMETRRAEIRRFADETWRGRERPKVYVEIWKEPLTTTGRGTFLDDLISLAGGANIASGLPEKYPHVASEWVIRENPDAILLLYMTGNGPASAVRNRTGWSGIRAVRANLICDGIPPDLLLRSGPRCLDGAERFAEWLKCSCPPR